MPGGRVLAQLAEVLGQFDDHAVHPVRVPVGPDSRLSVQHKRELQQAARARAKARAKERREAA